ncbi:MAG TPA: baseplate J/gp47 family protein [Candidatus Sulfotelmatobacter sp.]|jgi:phage-related baseplate assembly protein|nr:baseplate J/gp47 family protein [Candidatus Sulfotelmatobacter sp.]
MSVIDLSSLPAPNVIEAIDYETILAARKAEMKTALADVLPDWNPDLESDSIVKLLEESAYRETILRQRVNDAALATMLAYAVGEDLDQIGARYNVKRLVVTPADATTVPPTAAVMETDDRFRSRIQMAFEGFSTAGPVGAYTFHALSTSAKVKDCSVTSPTPGDVLLTVLSTEGDGTPDAALLDTVLAGLDDDDKRPLNDTVLAGAADVLHYHISAVLVMPEGPDNDTVLAAAQKAVKTYADKCHALEATVARSGIDGALHQAGVTRVILTDPPEDIMPTKLQAAYCTGIDVTVSNG